MYTYTYTPWLLRSEKWFILQIAKTVVVCIIILHSEGYECDYYYLTLYCLHDA